MIKSRGMLQPEQKEPGVLGSGGKQGSSGECRGTEDFARREQYDESSTLGAANLGKGYVDKRDLQEGCSLHLCKKTGASCLYSMYCDCQSLGLVFLTRL